MKNRVLGGFAVAIVAAMFSFVLSSEFPRSAGQSELASTAPQGQEFAAQRIFDQRCVVCHSCNNAPCQLNLTSFEGFRRGMSQEQVYQPQRLKSAAPSRLGIDASSEEEWRRRGFHPVMNDRDPAQSLLLQTLLQKQAVSRTNDKFADNTQTLDSNTCPVAGDTLAEMYRARQRSAMPYGFPAISDRELGQLSQWIMAGAPGSLAPLQVPAQDEPALKAWEQFFNGSDLKQKLVSRYMYEHLFLAHVHFTDSRAFYRLVRSATACDQGVRELPTRRPNDDPKAAFSYCFTPFRGTVVEKTHLPYRLDQKKLDWVKANFYATEWDVKQLPSYDEKASANPFATFDAIPVEARYRFLLEDAQYHVGTFIKGPVCNGNAAVNSIDEQFYVFFYEPKADLMVRDPSFREVSKDLLVLPAENGSNDGLLDLLGHFRKYPPIRNKYRKIRQAVLKLNFPQGLSLNEMWDGDNGRNDNALLTVLRHNDNAYVLKGARGDVAPSVYVLDYALFERLVYNLAVGFDVYGNLTHQLHTRVYMGMIRMEGENNYLDFVPPAYREPIRREEYNSSVLGRLEKSLIEAPLLDDHATRVELPKGLTPTEARAQMASKVLSERLLRFARQRPDPINWSALKLGDLVDLSRDAVQEKLSSLVSKPAKVAPWVRQFPDVALLAVIDQKGFVSRLFTIVRNKKANAVGSLLFENQLRTPELDTLQIYEGLAASYPNYFFVVPETQLSEFTQSVMSSSQGGLSTWLTTKARWGAARERADFWSMSDRIQGFLQSTMGVEAGVVDYTHYDLWIP